MSSSDRLTKLCDELTPLYAEADSLLKEASTDPNDLVSVVTKVKSTSLKLERLAVE